MGESDARKERPQTAKDSITTIPTKPRYDKAIGYDARTDDTLEQKRARQERLRKGRRSLFWEKQDIIEGED